MTFGEFSNYLSKFEKISSRIEITKVLAELFKKLENDECSEAVYLLLGGLAPKYKNIVFNIADKMMIRAIAYAHNIDNLIVDKEYKKLGDLGDACV